MKKNENKNEYCRDAFLTTGELFKALYDGKAVTDGHTTYRYTNGKVVLDLDGSHYVGVEGVDIHLTPELISSGRTNFWIITPEEYSPCTLSELFSALAASRGAVADGPFLSYYRWDGDDIVERPFLIGDDPDSSDFFHCNGFRITIADLKEARDNPYFAPRLSEEDDDYLANYWCMPDGASDISIQKVFDSPDDIDALSVTYSLNGKKKTVCLPSFNRRWLFTDLFYNIPYTPKELGL